MGSLCKTPPKSSLREPGARGGSPDGTARRHAIYSASMARLPKWVVDNRTAVDREAAPWRGRSPEEHHRALAAACRAAARQLAQRADRERLLAYRDPLPDSTLAALRRLRAAARRA